jgi:glyoxylate reductase
MARPRIFITQPVAESAVARLRRVAAVTVNPDASRVIGKRALLAAVRRCDILFCLLHDKIDKAVIAANSRLRMIAAMSVSPSHIDVAAATRRLVPVTVIPVLQTETTADLCFGLMIAVARRMLEGDRMVRAGRFPGAHSELLLGRLVHGKTLGLIGGGGMIGKAVARRARGFNMRVLYWAPRRKSMREERATGLVYAPLKRLLRESDFVSLHSPLNSETHHQVGAREFKLMKKTAYFINTARGAIVDEAALTRALKIGRIAGAGLDVFEFEPKVAKTLRELPNVVLTPHLGSAVSEAREAMAHQVADRIIAFLGGHKLDNCVNPEVFAL